MDPETTLMLAQQLAERGDFAQALEEYRRLLAQNPADTRVLLRMGDLLVRGQNIPAAIQVYDQAAAYYAHQGHGLKAVAVYKQVRDLVIGFEQIEPGVTDRYAHVVEQLAALYSALGLSNDALRVLDEEATRLRNLERDDDALALFRRMTDLAANVPLPYLRLGEGLYRVGQIDEAIGAFWSAAQLLLASNRSDDALRVIERMLHIKPVPKHAKIAARIYLEKGTEPEGKQALSRLQICFQADPTDLETLQMLSQAFGQIGQPERSVEVQKEIARLAHDQGRMDVLAQALAWLEPLAAEDEQVRALMHLAPPELRASSMPPVPVSSVPPRVSHAPHVPAHASVPPVPQSLAPQSLAPESIALDSIAPSGWPQAEALPPDGDFALQSLPPEAPPHEATQQSVSVAPSSAAPSSGPPISLVPRAASAPSVAPPPPSASRHSPPPKPADHPASSRPPRTHFPPPKPAGRSMRPDAPPSSPIAVPGTPPPLPPKARVSKAPPLPASFLEQSAAAASTSKRPTLERQLVGVSEPPPTVSADRATSPGPSAPVPPPQGIDEVLERSRRALADARAYRGLSLFHKAIETIQSALEFDSRSIELREMLRDLFTDIGDRDGAIEEMLTMAEIYVEFERADHARSVLQNILDEEPTCVEAQQMLQALAQAEPVADRISVPMMLVESSPPAPEQRPSASSSPAEFTLQDDSARAPHAAHGAGMNVPPAPAVPDLSRPPIPPPPPSARFSAAPPPPPSGRTNASDRPSTESVATAAQMVPPPADSPAMSIEEALEEVDFFSSRGMLAEAERLLERQLLRYPEHPLLNETLEEVRSALNDSGRASDPSAKLAPGAAAKPSDSLDFDLQASLGELGRVVRESMLPPAPGETRKNIDVDDVFERFKNSVKQQVADGDSATHYDLGIAYRDLNLLDDAIEELQLASRDADLECKCQTLIGDIYAEQRIWEKASKSYARALGAVRKTKAEETALYYELGNAAEMMSQFDQAVYYFRQVLRRDQTFKDARTRVNDLRSRHLRTPSGRPRGADEEVDRAFEDLMGD